MDVIGTAGWAHIGAAGCGQDRGVSERKGGQGMSTIIVVVSFLILGLGVYAIKHG